MAEAGKTTQAPKSAPQKATPKRGSPVIPLAVLLVGLAAGAYLGYDIAFSVKVQGNTGISVGTIEELDGNNPVPDYLTSRSSRGYLSKTAIVTYRVGDKSYTITVSGSEPAVRAGKTMSPVTYFKADPSRAWLGKHPRTYIWLKAIGILACLVIVAYGLTAALRRIRG